MLVNGDVKIVFPTLKKAIQLEDSFFLFQLFNVFLIIIYAPVIFYAKKGSYALIENLVIAYFA